MGTDTTDRSRSTIDTQVDGERMTPVAAPRPRAPRPETIVCASYKDAKNLAASERRAHPHVGVYATYEVARATWCVK